MSRGAERAVFLERSREAAAVIRENLKALGIENRAEVILGKAAQLLPRYPGDIVFLDPPYTLTREYEASLEALGLMRSPLVIAQHDAHIRIAESYGGLKLSRRLQQGDNILSFYVLEEQ